ncbi:InlB B-repeat-containing protein, partial [Candidatus Saccharibacteria bacterium]|nr:InlB B-repeat-containing protein [Candidatus Saccharibacteria bacterium]
GQTVDLYASNYNRDGYGFLGWSFDEDAAETLGTANESVIYGPNEEIIAPEYGEDEIIIGDTLVRYIYAIWLESSGTIQDWAGCGAMTTGSVIALTDNRDSNTYAVSKLGDGNCWMMENMRLSLDTATITEANTNQPTESFLANQVGTTSKEWSSWGGNRWQYAYNNDNINRSKTPSPTNNDDNSSWYSYGVLYSWSTVMAGNMTELSGDLCPSGWRFPTKNEMNTFIANQLAGNTSAEKAKSILKYPMNYVLSGYFDMYDVEAHSPFAFYILKRGESAKYAISDTRESDHDDDSLTITDASVSVYPHNSYSGKAAKCRVKELTTSTLSYNANGGDNAPQSTTSAPATSHYHFTVSAAIPTRTGYTFSGWMDKYGNEVFPNGTFITNENPATLYAIWDNTTCNPNATTIGTGNSVTDAVCLQDINTTIKGSMTLQDIYTLKDARDNKEYTLSLLEDGNIWLTKNLEIGNGTNMLFTKFDTDLGDASLFLLEDSQYIANNTYGNYYVWNASIADNDQGYYSSNTITTSLCPVGWDLPTSTQYSSLQSIVGFNSNKLPSSSPYLFNTNGGFYSGTILYNENYSYLWTSTAGSSSTTAYGVNNLGTSLSLSANSGTSSTTGAARTVKRNIRCIADNGTITLHYYGNGSIDYPVDSPSQIDRTVSYNEGRVASNSFVRNHYTFKSWNTNANGTGSTISSNATVISLNGQYNLYAQWTPNLTVIHHSNDTNQLTNEFDVKAGNSWKTLNYNAFTGTVNTKIGSWNTMPDGSGDTYNVNKTFTASSSLSAPTTLNLYAQWVQTYSFVYNGNGASEGSMSSVQQDNIAQGETIDLIAPNYNKTGYGFAGWSLNPNATVSSGDTIYGPNESIEVTSTILSNANNGVITFYAIWVQSSGTFQQFNPGDYASSPSGTVIALRDERDDNIYTVAKLADGQWWMIENLRLQLASYGSTTDNKTIVGAKSITDGTVTPLTVYNTNNPKDVFLIDDNFADDWKLIGNAADYYRVVDVNQTNFGIGNINKENEASYFNTDSLTYGPHQDKYWYSYGVMYNWYAATAGNGVWDGITNTNVEGSICPLGWRLPSGYTGGDVINLRSSIASFTSYPTNLVKSGLFLTGPTSDSATYGTDSYYRASSSRGDSSYYWTSTFARSNTSTTSSAYYMSNNMNNSGSYSYHKVYGLAVRCIANPQITYTINYNANGGEGAPASQTVENNTGIVEHISNTAPTRSGYTFSGWIDEEGKITEPNDPYIVRKTPATLFAIWTETFCNHNATTIGTNNNETDAVCLQDMNPTVKSSMIAKTTYNLVDSRNNSSYTLSLLDDGNVWMTQNLSIGNENDAILLSYHDTDIENGSYFILPGYNSTFDYGLTANTKPKFYASNNYGGYYSWAAAIASTNDITVAINTSICPAHWDLPTSEQYDNLVSMAGLTTASRASASPYNFVAGGYSNQGTVSSSGSTYLWTSTSATGSYSGNAYYSNAYSAAKYTNNYKRYGETIRCIASNGKITIHYEGNGTEAYPVTSTTDDQINVDINGTTVKSNAFRRNGYTFNGWNTAPDGSGTTYSGGVSKYNPTDGDVITLYAQWLPIYTINFYSNNASDLVSTTTATHGQRWYSKSSTTYTALTNNTKIGFWNTAPDGSGTSYTTGIYYDTPSNMTTPETLNLYAQWVPTYTIVYNGNGADGTSTMANISHINYGIGDYIDLYVPYYTKSGYAFVGWSINQNATANGNDTIYGPNERITITNEIISANENGVITFYAIWLASSGSIQNFDCSTLDSNEVVALTDSRDNNIYTVTKIVDNELSYSECWMTSNLRLSNTYIDNDTTVPVVLDTNNTHGLGGVFTGLANPETANFSSSTTANSLYSSSNITGSNIGDRMPRHNNSNVADQDNGAAVITDNKTGSGATINKNLFLYGNYYTWSAAVADTNPHNENGTVNITSSSICPKGWHLPTGNSNGEYQGLITVMQNNNTYPVNYPLNFVRNGKYSGAATTNRGSYGYYWTASPYSIGYATAHYFYAGYIGRVTNSQDYHYKYNGYAVRCVADDPVEPENPESATPDTEETTDDAILDTDQKEDENIEETETVEEEPEETSKETETDTQNDELENEDQ